MVRSSCLLALVVALSAASSTALNVGSLPAPGSNVDAAKQGAAQPPHLTKEQVSDLLDEATALLADDATLNTLRKRIDEAKKKKTNILGVMMPVVQDMMRAPMEKLGFTKANMFEGLGQVQVVAMSDPSLMSKMQKVMNNLHSKLGV